jgi:hypothetical protein
MLLQISTYHLRFYGIVVTNGFQCHSCWLKYWNEEWFTLGTESSLPKWISVYSLQPQYSSNLSPYNYFLWVYVKDNVYSLHSWWAKRRNFICCPENHCNVSRADANFQHSLQMDLDANGSQTEYIIHWWSRITVLPHIQCYLAQNHSCILSTGIYKKYV